MPPAFSPTGDGKNDYITIDGYIDWAIIPAGTIKKYNKDMPIRLRHGDQNFGHEHIKIRHSTWLKKSKRSVCEMLWAKLSLHSGKFYSTRKKSKVLLHIRLAPTVLVTLESQHDKNKNIHFFSVTTMYQDHADDDNVEIGTYSSDFINKRIKFKRPMR